MKQRDLFRTSSSSWSLIPVPNAHSKTRENFLDDQVHGAAYAGVDVPNPSLYAVTSSISGSQSHHKLIGKFYTL